MENYEALCDDDKHCYHTDNVALLTEPMKYRHICCFCGHSILVSRFLPTKTHEPQ